MKKKERLYWYTKLKAIKENLKITFGIDYSPVEIKIKYLYKDKKFIPLEGDILYVNLLLNNSKFELKQGWHRIKITYVRSGVVFFKYIDSINNHIEDHADLQSSFIEEAYVSTIRLNDISIPKYHLPLIKFKKGNCPFNVEVFDNYGNKLNDIVV